MNDTSDYLFTIPAYDETLSRAANIAVASGALASRLVAEQRTRTTHPDGRRENVSEHSHMLAKVAYALACNMYPRLDRGKVVMYAILHDDVEAYVGDTPTDRITSEERMAKKERETLGARQLMTEFETLMPEYAVSVAKYEAQREPEARFVRVVDKIMTLLIHIPNEGRQLKKNWTFAALTAATIESAERLTMEYPEYDELIVVRTEIAMYIARKYLLTK